MTELTRGRLDGAVSALQVVLGLTRPADAALRLFFRDHTQLGQRDRSFIAELVFTVLRHLRLLEHLVGDPQPRRLALAALSVQQGLSVRELAPNLTRDDEVWLAHIRAIDQTELPAGIRLSLPDWLCQRMAHEHEPADFEALARALLQPAALDLRVNTMLASREDVLAAFARDGITASATLYSPVGIRLEGKPALQQHPLFLEGKVEVQDEGSQLLAFLLAPRRREMVVDFCAGAGGKTLALGALMRSEGRLYAFDTAEKRLSHLKPRLRRSGLSNVHPQLIAGTGDARIKRLTGKIDRVLVDAPCSGLGTLRRNPDLKWRQGPHAVTELASKQGMILEAAARLVKPGGRLVYATCSLLREENEAVVDGFLGTHPDFAQLHCGELLERQEIALNTGPSFQVFPHRHGMDAFFACALERARESYD